MRNGHLYALVGLLLLAGFAIFAYKLLALDYPLTPDEQARLWNVEAQITFQAWEDTPIEVRLAVPHEPSGYMQLRESFISRNYGVATAEEGPSRTARWTVRRASNLQTLYYRVMVYEVGEPEELRDAESRFQERPHYGEPYEGAVDIVLQRARERSADVESFVREFIREMNTVNPDENVALLREGAFDNDRAWAERLAVLLAGAHISARTVHGLPLREVRQAGLEAFLEVHDGERWMFFDPRSGVRRIPEDLLVWTRGDAPLLDIDGGRDGALRFAVTQAIEDPLDIVMERAATAGSALTDFSPQALPVHTQHLYMLLFTIPLGALIVAVMRNVVGIATYGTFMPILIALAFRETGLLWGIGLFTAVIALGLLFRGYLERLKLLFVPRVAAVLTVVIMLLGAISVLSTRLELYQALTVGLFPMVIIAMTIERMSVVWEEHGGREAMLAALGSLVTAVLGYLVMTRDLVMHLLFVFPELLLVVLGLILLLGRYTGYRLTELWRFRHLVREMR